MINFVSHLPRDLVSGGFSAMNVAALTALEKAEEVHYAGPVELRSNPVEKAVSKVLRTIGRPGAFAQYSRSRMAAVALEVAKMSVPEARLDFFHGFTPWVLSRPSRPYVAWSDCTFPDYIEVFHDRRQFSEGDLDRIERAEGAWLRSAAKVLFTSEWAADRAASRYGLDRSRLGSVGIFGEIDAPREDVFHGGAAFLFISTNFNAKGGQTVLAAFRALKQECPEATLTVVGDCPAGLAREPGIVFEGFLRKENPAQNARLRQTLANARAIVHPTLSDIAPLSIVEAAYFGCPAIASRRYAIPELVEHGRSGILLDDPTDASELVTAMRWMLQDGEAYALQRRGAWSRSREHFSKRRFEERLTGFVRAAAS
ncbi:glycosyltransferase family 4 protein [Microbaculum marinum]|uniref:Glycosyltransferase family 4 protein n=1 Tax=Microbaculum marinum TaxID=1764581 RepID=A0AAW9RKN8_9HYPH